MNEKLEEKAENMILKSVNSKNEKKKKNKQKNKWAIDNLIIYTNGDFN